MKSDNMKNDNVIAVFESIKCIRQLYREIDSFFRSLDHLMGKNEYKLLGNSKITDNEVVLEMADLWLPIHFYRNYKLDSYNLINVNIYLTKNPIHKELSELKEPILVFAKYNFNKKFKKEYWAIAYLESREYDIYFKTKPYKKIPEKVYNKKDIFTKQNIKILTDQRLKWWERWYESEIQMIKDFKFIAVPLFDIKDENDIQKILKKIGLN
jgi:hypothetical protein